MSAWHYRVVDPAGASIVRNDYEATFLFVLSGRVTVTHTQDPPAENRIAPLTAGGFAYRPPTCDDSLHADHASEYVIIGALATLGAGVETGQAASVLSNGAEYMNDAPSAWGRHGLRKFFEYRNLHLERYTSGAIGLQLSRAICECPSGGTGFHYHTSSQIFFVLKGWVDLPVSGHGVLRVDAGDAVCLPAGAVHNVQDYSPGYTILEMFCPNVYETLGLPIPEEFAH